MRLRKRELQRKERQQREGFPDGEVQVGQHREAEQRLRGGENELFGLARVQRDAGRAAAADHVRERQASDQQGPLVHLGREQGAERGVLLAAEREQGRHQQLRRFRRERGQPLHQQELVDAEMAAALDQRLRERLGSSDHDHGRREEQRRHGQPAFAPRQIPQFPRHADQLGFRMFPLRGAPEKEPEQRQQHDRVVPGQPAGEGNDQ